MQYKVKIFSYKDEVTLQNRVNKWLSQNKVTIITIQSYVVQKKFYVFIAYTEIEVKHVEMTDEEVKKLML